MKIIAIDGLDGAGKSTYAKKLFHAAAEYNKEIGSPLILKHVHFPRYESETGVKIKEMLSESDIDINALIKLFAEDRALFWKEQKEEGTNMDRSVYIFDRYRFSNVLLNAIRFLKTMDLHVAIRKILAYDDELNNPKEDHLILPTCMYKIRMERLEYKSVRDRNEQNDNFNLLNSSLYPTLVKEYTDLCMYSSQVHVIRTDFAGPSWAMKLYDDLCVAEGLGSIGFPDEYKCYSDEHMVTNFKYRHLTMSLFSIGNYADTDLYCGVQSELIWKYLENPSDPKIMHKIYDDLYVPEK